ncbi:MAG: fructose-1,6-bisphosphate aldolase/phosphatase [Thermodesulfobacteriota bacterium]|nr:MAG: fructose-1,6-bisphosphate aldolase/phosphatase [Thermodesulfobacteriota bacterium]
MAESPKLTLTVITSDPGGYVGQTSSLPGVIDCAKERLFNAREKGVIIDFHVLRCGSEISLVITHKGGRASREIFTLAVNTSSACLAEAVQLQLCPPEARPGSPEGKAPERGPDIVEMEFDERASEPIIIFIASRAGAGTWNLPLYKIFADPFNTAGLVIDPVMFKGFSFKVIDMNDNTHITLSSPGDIHTLLGLAGITSRYAITSVHRNHDGEGAAAVSTAMLDGKGELVLSGYNPVSIVRCQEGFPSAGEAIEPFTVPYLTRGWLRNRHLGPLMPVPFYEANLARFDGPMRIISAGFQVSSGRLIGPNDMFDDPCFDETRRTAGRIAEYMRRHGPFEPHLLPAKKSSDDYRPPQLEAVRERFAK